MLEWSIFFRWFQTKIRKAVRVFIFVNLVLVIRPSNIWVIKLEHAVATLAKWHGFYARLEGFFPKKIELKAIDI